MEWFVLYSYGAWFEAKLLMAIWFKQTNKWTKTTLKSITKWNDKTSERKSELNLC